MDYAEIAMCRAKHLLRPAAALLLSALPLWTGCLATLGGGASELEASLHEDIRLLQEENQRLRGRVEGFDMQMEQVQRALDALRSAPGGPSPADVQALQQRVAALEGQLRALDTARERDRQEIIQTLTGKISQMVTPAARSRPAAPSGTRRGGAQEGYEHVVESGQTLSAIAAAYNVSPRGIVEANDLSNPDALRVGQKLFIPAP